MTRNALLQELIAIARAAGEEIMAVYATDFAVRGKDDASPVTEADERAEALIEAALTQLTPQVPIVAEEAVAAGRIPQVGERFWLVDPLDGTREFVSKNGEFTVNIALIEDGMPVVGVVYAPALGQLYVGAAGQGAWQVTAGGERLPLRVRAVPAEGLTVVASRRHGDSERMTAWLQDKPVAQTLAVGSSLKMCMIAAGQADLYLRFGRTMEWDTAAAHAILLAAGGSIQDLQGQELRYGKPGFANPEFIARAAGAEADAGAGAAPEYAACRKGDGGNKFYSLRPLFCRPGVIWLTGLSGAGKTTLARELEQVLQGAGHAVFRLDGDDLRGGLCRDLGFSAADRAENIRRAAELCRLLALKGITVIAAFISPIAAERAAARSIIESDGVARFFEVFVDTPLSVAEARDVKGLYRRARAGELPQFTGIDSPYEVPENPQYRVTTVGSTPQQSARQVLLALEQWLSMV